MCSTWSDVCSYGVVSDTGLILHVRPLCMRVWYKHADEAGNLTLVF